MDKQNLRQVLVDQQHEFKESEALIKRDVGLGPFLKGNEIVVITGIRRCGKSSLLKLISQEIKAQAFYVNFDDIRLSGFTSDDFQNLDDIAAELVGKGVFYIDEIQNIPLWERWANNLFAKGIKAFITGSNSSLLSSEISTFLTGRNKPLKLMPFSFNEFLRMKGAQTGTTSAEKARAASLFREYLLKGGFPVVLKNDDIQLSRQYFDDIVRKDVVARYGIRNIRETNDLLLYLISNTGRTFSYSALQKITGIKSFSTIRRYIDYFCNVYLVYTLERFDYSVARQKVSSSKPYAGDTGFLTTIAFSFSENEGKRLENAVFLELLRQGKETYYHHGKKECDFVVKSGLRISDAIQVCTSISNPLTRKRELEGLYDAAAKYGLKEGTIITMETEQEITYKGIQVHVKPAWRWSSTK